MDHVFFAKCTLEPGAKTESATYDIAATPLHMAARKGNLLVCEELVKAKANIDAICTYDNSPPIRVAAQNGHNKVVRFLLKQGALKDQKDPALMPIHKAARSGQPEVLRSLLQETDADLLTADDVAATPLHFASEHGHMEAVKMLIKARADVNRPRGDNGATPLHWAVMRGHSRVVCQLLEARADQDKRTTDNKLTPLHYAAAMDQHACMCILQNYHWRGGWTAPWLVVPDCSRSWRKINSVPNPKMSLVEWLIQKWMLGIVMIVAWSPFWGRWTIVTKQLPSVTDCPPGIMCSQTCEALFAKSAKERQKILRLVVEAGQVQKKWECGGFFQEVLGLISNVPMFFNELFCNSRSLCHPHRTVWMRFSDPSHDWGDPYPCHRSDPRVRVGLGWVFSHLQFSRGLVEGPHQQNIVIYMYIYIYYNII